MPFGHALMPPMMGSVPTSPKSAITVFIKIISQQRKILNKKIRPHVQLFGGTYGNAEGILPLFFFVGTSLCLSFSAPLNLPDIVETGIRIQRGLSSETIAAQLAALQAPPPPVSSINPSSSSASNTLSISTPGMGQFPANTMVPAQFTGYPSAPMIYSQPHPGGYYNNPSIPTQSGALQQVYPGSSGAAGNNS